MHSRVGERFGEGYKWFRDRPILTTFIIVVTALIIYSLVRVEMPEKGTGVLEGTVIFVGLPCMDGNVPPCNGAYPNYRIIIYSSDGRTEVATAVTGSLGNYSIRLPEGDYVVYSPSGPVSMKKNQVSVRPGVTARLDLTLDTGIRRT